MSGPVTGRRDLPDGVELLDETAVTRLVPVRPEDCHKGTFGSLLAVCFTIGCECRASFTLSTNNVILMASTISITLILKESSK